MANFTDDEIQRALQSLGGANSPTPTNPNATANHPQPNGQITDQDISQALERFRAMEQDPALQEYTMDRLRQLDFQKWRDNPTLADDYLTGVAGTLGKPGLNDAAVRSAMSFVDPNSQSELKAMFQKFYPKGDLAFVAIPVDHKSHEAGSTVMIYRTGPREKWARFDQPGLEGYDIADLAGAAPQILGETAGSLLAGPEAGMGVRTVLGAVGAAGGEALNSEALQALGVRENEPLSVLAARGADAALMSLIAGATGYGIGQVGRLGTGAVGLTPGVVTVSKAGQGALEAEAGLQAEAKSIGSPRVKELTVGQLAESPVLQQVYGIAETVSKRVSKMVEQQLSRVNTLIAARNKTPAMQAELNGIEQNVMTAVQQWRRRAIDAIKSRAVLPRTGGISAQDAIEAWRLNTQAMVSTLYKEADAISPVIFDIKPLLAWRQSFEQRLRAGAIQDVSPEIRQTITQIDAILANSAKQGRGTLLTTTTLPDGTQLFPWDLLESARGNAFRGTLTPPGKLRVDQDVAESKGLMKVISDVIENPVASNVSDRAKWNFALNDARRTAAKRFDDIKTFEGLASARAFEFDPSGFARSLMDPTKDELPLQVHKMLTEMGMNPRWDAIVDGVHGELVHRMGTNPSSVVAWLDQWRDPATRRLFVSSAEEASLRKSAANMQELDKMGWENVVKNDTSHAQVVMDMVDRGDKAGLHRLIGLPPSDPLRKSVRAGMLDYLANMTTVMKGRGATKGAEMPDIIRIRQTLDRWKETGADKLLTADDKTFMENVWKYVSFSVAGSGNTGTRIAGASKAEALFGGGSGNYMMTLMDWARHLGYGWALTSPAFRRILIGARPGSGQGIANATVLLGQVTEDLLEQARNQPAGSRAEAPRPVTP